MNEMIQREILTKRKHARQAFLLALQVIKVGESIMIPNILVSACKLRLCKYNATQENKIRLAYEEQGNNVIIFRRK